MASDPGPAGSRRRTAVIIPHYNGWEILHRCLVSLESSGDQGYSVYLVDNGSSDGSPQQARTVHPWINVISAGSNLGFAGGCNLGIRSTEEEFVVLLNNDTEVEPGWLAELVQAMDFDPRIAAAQPKIRWLKNKEMLDYAGGAGGLMDIYGYPFCRGRLFETLEPDQGQYDHSPADIFWASGSVAIFRRSALEESGLLDETFFMHMEEIDLCWRLHLLGYRVVAVPKALVCHLSGGSLPAGQYLKMYLNHRNSLLMLLKNYSLPTLSWIWPVRMALELAALAKAVASRNWTWARAIVSANCWIMEHQIKILNQRRRVQRLRRLSDLEIMKKMYRGSVAWQYFLRGRTRASQLSTGGE